MRNSIKIIISKTIALRYWSIIYAQYETNATVS